MNTYSEHLATFGTDETLDTSIGIETLEKFSQGLDQFASINSLDFYADDIEEDHDGFPFVNVMDLCWIKSYDDRKLWFRFLDETGRPRRNEFPVDLQFVITYLKAQTSTKNPVQTRTSRVVVVSK